MGRTQGGHTTKLMPLTGNCGRLLAATLVPGQAYGGKCVADLLSVNRKVLAVGQGLR